MSERKPLWGGRFGSSPAEAFSRLNASIPFDVRLAPYDVRGSIAHATMLAERGIISPEERAELVRGLEAVLAEVEAGEFTWSLEDEDVHTAVERRLREVVGDVALKLHTGRSRNDQVALDLHLFARDAAEGIGESPFWRRCGRWWTWPRRTGISSCPATPTCSAPSLSCSPTTSSRTSRR